MTWKYEHLLGGLLFWDYRTESILLEGTKYKIALQFLLDARMRAHTQTERQTHKGKQTHTQACTHAHAHTHLPDDSWDKTDTFTGEAASQASYSATSWQQILNSSLKKWLLLFEHKFRSHCLHQHCRSFYSCFPAKLWTLNSELGRHLAHKHKGGKLAGSIQSQNNQERPQKPDNPRSTTND